MEFQLSKDYIELIKLLKIMGIAETGGMAKNLVEDEQVYCNGAVETRKRLKVRKGDKVRVADVEINVI